MAGAAFALEAQHVSMGDPLPYPPPWQDTPTLCAHLSVSANTITNWVAQGILPPPRKRGGKLMWKWAEVDEKLTLGDAGGTLDDQASKITESVRRASLGSRK